MSNQPEVSTKILDHHGLVAGICRDISLEKIINERIGSSDPRRIVQPGKAVVAMVIAGLGFTTRRLYLTPKFFKNKPIEKLLGEGVHVNELNEHSLGKALDEIHRYGTSKLFAEIAFSAIMELGLLSSLAYAHLDSTSFSLHGDYHTEEGSEVIEVKRGYSKDHRPDLKQVMLNLVVGTKANLPLWMESCDGNSSDKTSFHETTERMDAFCSQFNANYTWVADSAFYSADKIKKYTAVEWISRVPETIGAAKEVLGGDKYNWKDFENGYSYTELGSVYGGVRQSWILVKSEQAYKRESVTVEKKVVREKEKLGKSLWHLNNELFSCSQDAVKAANKLKQSGKYCRFDYKVEEELKYTKAGRPNFESAKQRVGYRVIAEVKRNEDKIVEELRRKGRFIIATNRLDLQKDIAIDIIKAYKEQSTTEQGFSFLKDPWFLVDKFFVKKRSRIDALMMIMSLCLFIYRLGQYRLRRGLNEQNSSVPNQKGKPTQTPTLRWAFELMEGTAVLFMANPSPKSSDDSGFIINMEDSMRRVVKAIGGNAVEIYNL